MTQTKTAARRRLRMIYQQIPPASPCKAGCFDCCGPVPWSAAELALVQADVPSIAQWTDYKGVRALENPITGMCPFASKSGCQVYDRRPFMCRLFAASLEPMLRCPHGCASKRPLTKSETDKLAEHYYKEERG